MIAQAYSYGTTPQEVVLKALDGKPYWMGLTGNDATLMVGVVNEGIDSHLEAVTESEFHWEREMVCHRLMCSVSPHSMWVVLRRLLERDAKGDDEAGLLRTDILTTLEIEEI